MSVMTILSSSQRTFILKVPKKNEIKKLRLSLYTCTYVNQYFFLDS